MPNNDPKVLESMTEEELLAIQERFKGVEKIPFRVGLRIEFKGTVYFSSLEKMERASKADAERVEAVQVMVSEGAPWDIAKFLAHARDDMKKLLLELTLLRLRLQFGGVHQTLLRSALDVQKAELGASQPDREGKKER